MNLTLEVRDLSVGIVAGALNFSFMTLDFLQGSGVIPADWQLAKPPISSVTKVEFFFQNGVSLLAQGNQIVFSEEISSKDSDAFEAPLVAVRLIRALPEVAYQGVSVQMRGHVPFAEHQQAQTYFAQQFLASRLSEQPISVQTSIKLNYPLRNGMLTLDVVPVGFKEGETVQPAVLFNGNLGRGLAKELATAQRVETIQSIIQGIPEDLAAYEAFVHQRFLENAEMVNLQVA